MAATAYSAGDASNSLRAGPIQSSSAARLATSLRSQAVSVTWPKQGWPPKAWVSTARALFDSPRYGASIWLVSPVNTTFVPSPTRVRIVRSVVGSRFWASSMTTIWRCSDRPRRNVTDSSDSWPRAVSSSIRRRASAFDCVVGEGDDGVVDGGHPRVELLVEPAGQEPDVGPADRHERAVDRRAARSGRARRPARARRRRRAASCPCRPGRRGRRPRSPGRAAARARSAAPSSGPAGPTPPARRGTAAELVADAPGQRRLRAGAQHGELVLADAGGRLDGVGGDGAGGVQAVDDLVAGLDRRPARRPATSPAGASAGARRRRRRGGRP